jgi:hypothetical protein
VVVVGERPGSILLLDKGDLPTEVDAERFASMPVIPIESPGVLSASGRLWAAERARTSTLTKARWRADLVEAAAERFATIDLGARRAAAVDLAMLGLPDMAYLRLTAAEMTWYRARAAAVQGDAIAMIDHLERLRGGYPDRIRLIAVRFTEILCDPALAARAAAVLAPFEPASTYARAVRSALAPTPAPDMPQILVRFARSSPVEGARRTASQIATADSVDAVSGAADALRRLNAYLLAQQDCRMNPGSVDDATLRRAAFVAELARRAYVRGDDDALTGLPERHEAVRHYRALREFVVSGQLDERQLRPATAGVAMMTEDLSLSFPFPREADEQIAADPSTWWYLRNSAMDGKITATDIVRSRYPRFAEWLDICHAHRVLRAGDWDRLLSEHTETAWADAAPHVRAAALNVLAYAHWQLGQSARGLELLDQALTAHPSVGLAVNGALIAGESSCLNALDYLARAMKLAKTAAERGAILARGIDLWIADPAVPDCPPTLVALIRGELSSGTAEGDVHRRLLLLALRHDRQWLASARLATGASPDSTRYLQARAAVEEQPTTSTYTEAANALADLLVHKQPPVWAASEPGWLAGVLARAVSQLDATADPVPAIARLTSLDALPLGIRLYLIAIGGRRLIAASAARGREVQPEQLDKFVLAPIRTYQQRKSELGNDDRQHVAMALADCLGAAIAARVNLADAAVLNLNRLAQTAAQDRPKMRTLLADLRRHMNICRNYLELAPIVPMDRERLGVVRARLARLSADIDLIRPLL